MKISDWEVIRDYDRDMARAENEFYANRSLLGLDAAGIAFEVAVENAINRFNHNKQPLVYG
jgi:hypothetical protein